jgi:hypothetical protein
MHVSFRSESRALIYALHSKGQNPPKYNMVTMDPEVWEVKTFQEIIWPQKYFANRGCCLLEYNTVQSCRNLPTFQRKLPTPPILAPWRWREQVFSKTTLHLHHPSQTIPWNGVLLEKLMGLWLIKKFLAHYGLQSSLQSSQQPCVPVWGQKNLFDTTLSQF